MKRDKFWERERERERDREREKERKIKAWSLTSSKNNYSK